MTFWKPRTKAKFGNKRVKDESGRSFMSMGERDCAGYLRLLEGKGEISDLEYQVTVRLSDAQIRCVPDFKFYDKRLGETVWADFKGFETTRWNDIKKLWKHYGPGRLRIYKGRGLRIAIVEEIIPVKQSEQEGER